MWQRSPETDSDTRKRATPRELGVAQIVKRAWIEDWLAGRASGAPVFGDLGRRSYGQLLEELRMAKSPQGIFVEYRYLLPFAWLIELRRIDVGLAYLYTKQFAWRVRKRVACARSEIA